MASANTDFNEIVSTTLKKRRKKFADNVLNHNALLRWLMQKGHIRMVDGGETLVEELEYAENTTFKYYSGYETLDMTPSEVFSSAEFAWKQAAVVVGASGLELRKNAGSETRMINLLDARMRNAEKTMKNQLSTGAYSNGTGSGGKQIGGLQLLVADAPSTGTVGGIDRASFSFWQNQINNETVNDATTIQGHMNDSWIALVRGADHPDLIVADTVVFGAYWKSLQTIQRITSADSGKSGYRSLEFNGPGGFAPVFHDDAAPASHMYFLNTDYLFWNAHQDANMSPLARRDSFNQDAIAVPVIFMGNLTMSNASLQGVLF